MLGPMLGPRLQWRLRKISRGKGVWRLSTSGRMKREEGEGMEEGTERGMERE